MARKPIIFVCSFDSAGELRGKRRTYEAVKEAVLAAGRYSAFEASNTPRDAALFTRLDNDPDVIVTRLGYPWYGVKRAPRPR